MAKCKTAATPLLTHWIYSSLALNRRNVCCSNLTRLVIHWEERNILYNDACRKWYGYIMWQYCDNISQHLTECTKSIKMIESTRTTSMGDVSTWLLEKIKNILEVKIKPKNYMMYQDIYIYLHMSKYKKTTWRYTIHYVKHTAQLLFKNRFPKGGPTCRRQVVNPRHQTSQGQSVAKPETPLQNIQVE